MVQFYFLLIFVMVMYVKINEFKTKGNKIQTMNTIEPQHVL